MFKITIQGVKIVKNTKRRMNDRCRRSGLALDDRGMFVLRGDPQSRFAKAAYDSIAPFVRFTKKRIKY